MRRLLPVETHIASHLIRIGCLTPRITRTEKSTIISVPIFMTDEYAKCLMHLGLNPQSDLWDLERVVASLVPTNPSFEDFAWVEPIYHYMVAKGMYINMYGGYNIVYVEGASIIANKLVVNDDAQDMWNDLRVLFSFENGRCSAKWWVATTEPGKFYTQKPMNPSGAARIAFGQHRAWVEGKHQRQTALVQSSPILLHRDLNRDGLRTGDKMELCSSCGINQHTTDGKPSTIGKWSAGCLVGQDKNGHNIFMSTLRKDFRNHKGYEYVTTVLDPSKF